MIGIYAIINKVNGKRYIGLSRNIEYRFYKHKVKLRGNIHPNKHLQSAWNQYNENNFEFVVLETTGEVDKLSDLEKFYIAQYDSYNNGYNKTVGGEEAEGFVGKRHSDETLQIMSQKSKARWQDEEFRQRVLPARQERMQSEEYRTKMSNLSKGDNNGNCKLTEQDAIRIKLHYLRSNNRYGIVNELHKLYPMIVKGAIQKIYKGKTWKHLPNTIEELEHMLINYQI